MLGLPFIGVVFGLPDDRVLPASADSRQVSNVLRTEFTGNEDEAFAVVIPDSNDSDAVTVFATEVSTFDGVARVDALSGSFVDGQLVAPANASSARFAADQGTWFSVVPSVERSRRQGRSS